MASGRDDMWQMISSILRYTAIGVVAATLTLGTAAAQIVPPPTGGALLPVPAPIPPPRIEVPIVPQLDALPATPKAQLRSSRKSFGDRITDCLQDGAAAGLDSSDRSAYSRGCANR